MPFRKLDASSVRLSRCCSQSERRSHVIRITRNWSVRHRLGRRPPVAPGFAKPQANQRRLSQSQRRTRRSCQRRAMPQHSGRTSSRQFTPSGNLDIPGKVGFQLDFSVDQAGKAHEVAVVASQGAQVVPTRRDQRPTSIHLRTCRTRRRVAPYHEIRFREGAPAHRRVGRPNPACRASETATSHEVRPATGTPLDTALGAGACRASNQMCRTVSTSYSRVP